MQCLVCESFSLTHICSACQKTFLTPSLYKRRLADNVDVFSFYDYAEIKHLLYTKHSDLGYYIYKILAKNSFAHFAQEFTFAYPIHSIAVDDIVQDSYAHTALLNNALQSSFIKPLHARLRAKNRVSYAGMSRAFREANPRDFVFHECMAKEVILVDDIITTGMTLTHARKALQAQGVEVLFCLTLADARRKEK